MTRPLLGKKATLHTTLDKQQHVLQTLGIDVVFTQVLNPLTGIHSCHLKCVNAPSLFANGKGVCADSAKASALGEFLERLGSGYYWVDYQWHCTQEPKPSWQGQSRWFALSDVFDHCLSADLWAWTNPHQTLVPEDLISPQTDQAEVYALAFDKLGHGETVWWPWHLLNMLMASNGLASGNSHEEALVQATSEILERYVKQQVIGRNLSLPLWDESQWRTYHAFAVAVEEAKTAGFAIRVLDATLGGQWPVAAVLITQLSSGKTLLSFGAHPLAEVAFERAMTEAFQGRDLNQVDVWMVPTVDETLITDASNLEQHFIDSNGYVGFALFDNDDQGKHWPYQPSDEASINDQWNWLIQHIQQAGFDLYSRQETFPWPVVRVVIPRMSEVYATDDWLEDNTAAWRYVRQAWQADNIQDLAQVCDELGLTDYQHLSHFLGVVLDDDWALLQQLTIGDVQALASCWLYQHRSDEDEAKNESLYWQAEESIQLALNQAAPLWQGIWALADAWLHGVQRPILQRVFDAPLCQQWQQFLHSGQLSSFAKYPSQWQQPWQGNAHQALMIHWQREVNRRSVR